MKDLLNQTAVFLLLLLSSSENSVQARHRLQQKQRPKDIENIGLNFIEVPTLSELKMSEEANLESKVQSLHQKQQLTENEGLKTAITQTIDKLKTNDNEVKQKPVWGIYNYSYQNGKCDYYKANNLEDGQSLYRIKSNDQDYKASLFIASGAVQRQKGDQVAIESCIGQALLNGHMMVKAFDSDKVYVVNHELNTIYNDLKKFDKDQMDEALAQFSKFPQQDTTIMVRGKDGQIIKKKGEDLYVAQNLAYLYNDSIVNGKVLDKEFNYKPLQDGEIEPFPTPSFQAANSDPDSYDFNQWLEDNILNDKHINVNF